MSDDAKPAPKKKLPVVDAGKPAKGGKAARLKSGGWTAFTDGGAAPRPIIAARIAMLLAFLATIPVVLGAPDGNRIVWTICIAALPFFWIVAGYPIWRRICPL